MALEINWSSKVISIPQNDLQHISGNLYELDVDAFRLALKDAEDSEEGMIFDDTHRHNAEVVLSGVTYARVVEIINGYTISFEDTNSVYAVRCVGANHNLADVTNYDGNVSLIIGNSAGLVKASAEEMGAVFDVQVDEHQLDGSFGKIIKKINTNSSLIPATL